MFYFRKVFAQNGDITLVPMDNQNDGKVSYDEGWPEGYELDPTIDPDEAQNLSRTNFNGLFYSITSVLQHLQQYGVNPYITSTDNGGEAFAYPLGGTCSYIDPTTGDYGIYYSLRSNNTDVPSENGITTKFWQRIFAKDWDVLKSNRVTNAPLYFIGEPTYAFEDNIVTFTIPHGSKFLFANGYNSDYTLNSDIVYIQNDATVTLDTTGLLGNNYYLFISSEEEAILLTALEYSPYETENFVVTDKGLTSDSDVYYYNRAENKWKKRIANTSAFIDIDYSLCLVASVGLKEAEIQTFETANTLQLVSYKEFETTLAKKQNTLIAGSHISLSPATLDTTVVSANVPSNVTPFAVNSCNLDSSGDIDLLTSDSASTTIQETKLIEPYGGNEVTASYAGGTTEAGTPSGALGDSGAYFICGGFYENAILSFEISFNNPKLIYDAVLSFYLSAGVFSPVSMARPQSNYLFVKAVLYFSDGTISDSPFFINIPSYFTSYSGTINYSIPSTNNGKYISKVVINILANQLVLVF